MPKLIRNVALKTALFASGKRQEAIAKAARLTPQQISHALVGRRALDADERKRLARVLGKSEDELFGASDLEVAS